MPLNTLKTVFGYDSFRLNQAEIIDEVIAGGEALVLMPTGGGKSLCYQIPAIVREGTGIVVSPLIALMQDQVSSLVESGVRAAFLNSTLARDEANRIESELLAGELDLLYVAPERLMNGYCLDMLKRAKICLFAIDEAHCVSQWGHDFRPEYRQLTILHEQFPGIPRIALTATADEVTRNEIIERLSLQSAKSYISGFDRPNIRYHIGEKQSAKDQLLRFIDAEHKGDAGIVYCLSRKKVEETAAWLSQQGWDAVPYHAGLRADIRSRHQERFLKEEGVVVVATIAFGMGIDKPNVRFVAHLDLPSSLEAYYQETGRAGRDGLPANAWMVYGMQDVVMRRQMLSSSDADDQRKRVEHQKLDAMLGFCEVTSCRRHSLLDYFDDALADLEKPCGNCDNCLEPPETWDGTDAARKALSCAYRTEQRFGMGYLIDVLVGKETDRILQFGHDKLAVFGVGDDLTGVQWRAVFRQLTARGYLQADIEGFGSLKLSSLCGPVLKGTQRIELRKVKKKSKAEKSKSRSRSSSKFEGAEGEFWEALRTKRKALADEHGVPPYAVFHDATLMAMMEVRPKTLDEFSELSGVGARKLEQYGDTFLAIIAEHSGSPKSPQLNGTAAQTFELFEAGKPIDAIAGERKLSPGTIYSHLSDAIAAGMISLSRVIDVSEEDVAAIEAELHRADGLALKPVYEALGEKYDYHVLRCVQAAVKVL